MDCRNIVFISLLIVCCYAVDPDAGKDVPQLIRSKGYPCEIHNVTTEDGFILTLHRIPHGKDKIDDQPRKPIFLQHGLLSSSVCWVWNLAYESLGFILADQGYDVWMGNSRGNVYSLANTHLSPSDSAFWQWSWDEMGEYDLPASINYALQTSKQEHLAAYIGTSQGTAMAFAAFSYDHQLASKVKLFISLAPVAYTYNIESLLFRVLAELDVDKLFELLGYNEFMPSTETLRTLMPEVCSFFPTLCDDVVAAIVGIDQSDLNETRIPVYLGHFPAGTSVMDISHWAQGVRKNVFQRYDYGSEGNMKHYNQPTPPPYNVTDIPKSLPLAFFTGGKDVLADPADVKHLLNLLDRDVFVHFEPDYGHVDPTWGINCYKTIYPIISKLIPQHNS